MTALKVIGSGMGVLAFGIPGLASAASKPKLAFRNEDFYKNGKFDPEAGKDAIITEAATYHDNAAVRHSDPEIVFP